MMTAREIVRRSSHMMDDVSDAVSRRGREHDLLHRSSGIGGLILLGLAIAVFVWTFPELRRYMRIERM